jgi:hypothetical protein
VNDEFEGDVTSSMASMNHANEKEENKSNSPIESQIGSKSLHLDKK